MDKNTIIQAILGLFLTVLLTCIGWLFTSITNLQHENNLQGKDIESNAKEARENEEAIEGVWKYIDNRTEKRETEMLQSFEFATEMMQKQQQTELEVKELEIKMLESELKK